MRRRHRLVSAGSRGATRTSITEVPVFLPASLVTGQRGQAAREMYQFINPSNTLVHVLEPYELGQATQAPGFGVAALGRTAQASGLQHAAGMPRLFGVGAKSLLDNADEEGTRFFTEGRIAIPAQEVTLFFGDGKTGKSAQLQYLAVCVAGAQLFHGQEVPHGTVIYIDAENGWEMTRARLIALARAVVADLETVNQYLQLRSIRGHRLGDHVNDLLAEAAELKPVLVVADGLVSVFGINPVDGEEVYRAFRVLNSLCDLGVTVGLIHHISSGGKGNASPGQPPPPAGNRYIQHFVRASYYVDRTYIQAMPNNYDIPELRAPLAFKALEVGGLPQLGRAKSPSAKRRKPKVPPENRDPAEIVAYLKDHGGDAQQAAMKRHLAGIWGIKPGQVGRTLTKMLDEMKEKGVVETYGPPNAPSLRLGGVAR